jgi:hypothetical protein
VSAAYFRDGDAVIIEFDDGTEIRISLKPEDKVGLEAGHFRESSDPGSPLLDFSSATDRRCHLIIHKVRVDTWLMAARS